MAKNELHSGRNYAGMDLRHLSADEFSDSEIVGACFSQESDTGRALVFPPGTKNVTFTRCNLDNVMLPPGSVLVRSSNRRFRAQIDGHDWECDEQTGQPIRPMNEKWFEIKGKSKRPEDIVQRGPALSDVARGKGAQQ